MPYEGARRTSEAQGREEERKFIVNMLENRLFWLIHLDKLAEAEELRTQIALIKEEN